MSFHISDWTSAKKLSFGRPIAQGSFSCTLLRVSLIAALAIALESGTTNQAARNSPCSPAALKYNP